MSQLLDTLQHTEATHLEAFTAHTGKLRVMACRAGQDMRGTDGKLGVGAKPPTPPEVRELQES